MFQESFDRSFNPKPHETYIGRSLLFIAIGLLQSSLICLGDLFYLNIQCQHPVYFLFAGWFTSIVYVSIIYALTVSFGDIGKAVCVVLLVMQVAGSGGTFPIEVAPDFFQKVYPLLPFTYKHECHERMYCRLLQHSLLERTRNISSFSHPRTIARSAPSEARQVTSLRNCEEQPSGKTF